MADGRGGKRFMGPLLAVNSVVYMILLGLAAWSLDKYIDGQQNHPLMGACSVFTGLAHLRVWNNVTLASAATSAILSWAITLLAFGLVCKQITMGGRRGKRLQTLEAFVVISSLSQLMYLLLLHAGIFNSTYEPAYHG